MPARVSAIIQLCLAFTLLFWHASLPFMGDLFAVKSRMTLYRFILDHPEAKQLPPEEYHRLTQQYAALQGQLERPFLLKVKYSFYHLVFEIPPLVLMWIVLSILVPILLLKKVEGASSAAFLLPLIVIAFGLDNRLHTSAASLSAEAQLFPSEDLLVRDYVKQSLSKNIFEQQAQLKEGWENYLRHRWGGEMSSLSVGEFAFHYARLKAIRDEMPSTTKRESLFVLGLYLFWNLTFALLALRRPFVLFVPVPS